MTITPDTKDWTWVLERPCPECGFDTQGFPVEAVPGMIMANTAAWQAALDGASDARARPEPSKWSPLEYACHVRDVFRLYDQRLELMLSQDDPLFPNWDQDETAVADRYGEQDPAEVAAELRQAAFAIAGRFEGVTGDQWQRTGARSDGARFTVETFARYFVHDPVHHLYDVTGQRAVRLTHSGNGAVGAGLEGALGQVKEHKRIAERVGHHRHPADRDVFRGGKHRTARRLDPADRLLGRVDEEVHLEVRAVRSAARARCRRAEARPG